MNSLQKLPHDIITDELQTIVNTHSKKHLLQKFKAYGEKPEITHYFCEIWKTKTLKQLNEFYDYDCLRKVHEMAQSYLLKLIRLSGNKSFIITPELSRSLYFTDIKVPGEFIKFPYRTFIIYPTFSGITPFLDSLSSIIVDIKTNGNEITIETGCLISIKGELESTTIGRFIFPNDSIVSLNIIQNIKSEKSLWKINANKTEKEFQIDKQSFKETMCSLYMYIINVALYINETKDIKTLQPGVNRKHLLEIKNPKKKAKYEKRLKEESLYAIRYIGTNYTEEYQRKHDAFSGLTYEYTVRGHWRMQWFGEKISGSPGKYQKPIWIEPFKKGKGLLKEKGIIYTDSIEVVNDTMKIEGKDSV